MTGSHVLWHTRSSWQTHHTGLLCHALCHAFFVAICISAKHSPLSIFSCHSLLITFQQWPESGKKFRGFVILSWRIEWLNELFFSHSKIFRILRYVSIYWHVSSLYWDIDQVGTHDTCHTVSHNVTWRPCQISWQPCHFIINFIYKSKYLITKENIQSQWFLNQQIFFIFLPN